MVARFSEILGQERAVDLLRCYISRGTAPHGLLFSGEEGVGKETAARVFLAALLCRAPGEDGACGTCHDCRLFTSSSHPNFLKVVPKEGSKSLQIEKIRTLQEELSLKAFSDRPRVAILAPADRMTPQAANALLKTLEEPPPNTCFILIAHRVAAIMPTIVSRCQKVPFFPLPVDMAAEILAGLPDIGENYSSEIIRLACAAAGGSPGRAQSLLPDIENERDLWMAAFSTASAKEIIDLAETFKGEGGDGRFTAPLTLARDLALLSSGVETAIINNDLQEKLLTIAAHPPVGGWDVVFKELLAISRMPPQTQKRLMLEAFFFGMRRKG